ncbi:MAG TPA: hypothetical protein VNN21_08645 [Dehalococcoidia bacterium]|nr:hypothetical protein [Dehalococcoidia bacterium]
MPTDGRGDVRPRVLVRITRGLVDIHSDSLLDLIVVETDLEVKAEGVYQLHSTGEFGSLVQRYSHYRSEPFFSMSLDNPE